VAGQSNSSNALPWLARMIAQQCAVDVRFDPKASTAYITAQRQIVLPALPADDPNSTALTLGYLVHEAAHARFTDFGAGKGAPPLQEAFHQVIEDLRIEKAIQAVLPGAAGYLAGAWELVYADGKVMRPGDQARDAAFEDLWAWLMAFCRWNALGLAPAAGDLPKGRAAVLHHLGDERTKACEEVFEASLLCNSTTDTYDRAADLLRILRMERSEEESPESDDDVEAAGGESDETDAGDDSSGGASEQPDDASCSAQEPESLEEVVLPPEMVNPMEMSAQELLARLLVKAREEARAEGKVAVFHVAASAEDRVEKLQPGDGPALYARARQATTALRARLQHLLRTLTESKVEVSRRGRPQVTQLWRLRTGNPYVFEDEQEGPVINTALTLLLDVSSSMRGRGGELNSKIELTKLTAMAVLHALEGVDGFATAAYAFPGEGGNGLKVSKVKGFGDRVQRVSSAIAGLTADGGTPLAAAVYAVGPEIAATPKALKILVVVSDGEPDDVEAAKKALHDARAAGVEVIGVGIKQDLSHLVPTSQVINEPTELAPALFKILSERQAQFLRQAA
jgi:cobaltochelatase CobT